MFLEQSFLGNGKGYQSNILICRVLIIIYSISVRIQSSERIHQYGAQHSFNFWSQKVVAKHNFWQPIELIVWFLVVVVVVVVVLITFEFCSPSTHSVRQQKRENQVIFQTFYPDSIRIIFSGF